jgi:serine/threonine protein phosphatase PrpC
MPVPLSPPRLYRLPIGLACGATDIGPVRDRNEDNYLIDEALGLAMVADGMGGHAAGEVASAGALTGMQAYLAHHAAALVAAPPDAAPPDPDTTWSDPAAGAVRLLHAAIAHTNASLYAQNCARGRRDGGGMGATLTGFWRPPGSSGPLVAFHVGDTRLYRWRAGVLEQLTRDQTLYQQALEAGMLDHLPARNLLLQAVGPSAAVTPEVRSHRVAPGDVLMLCSDGLHGSVPHGDIEAMLATAHDGNLDAVCAKLIGMATSYGGRDNITVLAARCGQSA